MKRVWGQVLRWRIDSEHCHLAAVDKAEQALHKDDGFLFCFTEENELFVAVFVDSH